MIEELSELTGTPESIQKVLSDLYDWELTAGAIRKLGFAKAGLLDYQGHALAVLARDVNKPKARILEVGTNHGYSAAVMRLAAPQATIVTLEPVREVRKKARENLEGMAITVDPHTSAAYLEESTGRYDLIFVDGDHKHIGVDLPWFNHLRRGGLILFHDYSPEDAEHPCPPVYKALTEGFLERPPDILIRDDGLTGMAGWYRRQGESYGA